MGRPLKIQKLSTGSGNGGASVGVDLAYPNFGSVTDPVKNSVGNMTNAQYYGVVGGAAPTDSPSATNPRIDVTVNIANPSGTGLGSHTGYIIRQKGAHKYLVGDANAAIDPANFVVGQAYQIVSVGNTPWSTIGGGNNVSVGQIFTATAAAAAGTSGTAYPVGICVLTNSTSPTVGLMAITYTNNDSTATPISKLTNKWILDWTGGSTYAATEVVNDVRYLANFFTDEGTAIKSGTTGGANVSGQQNLVDLVIVDNVTS